MIKQKTFLIVANNINTRAQVELENMINKKVDKFLKEIQEEGHTPFSVAVSSKDDMQTQHCFIATIMYRENVTREVMTEKTKS